MNDEIVKDGNDFYVKREKRYYADIKITWGVSFDARKLDPKRRKLASTVKLLVSDKNDLYRTYDYKKMRKESPIVMLDDLETIPRRILKEAAK